MLHKEPLTRLYTSLCGIFRTVFVQLQHLTTLCTCYSDGNKLQSSLDSKKNKRQSMDGEGKLGEGEGEGEGMAISLMIPLCTRTRAQSHLSRKMIITCPIVLYLLPKKVQKSSCNLILLLALICQLLTRVLIRLVLLSFGPWLRFLPLFL